MIRSVPMGATFTFQRMGRIRGLHGPDPISLGVSVGISALNDWLGSIQTSHNADTATTLIVNGLEQQLKNLNGAYFSEQNPSCADQRAALNAFDQAWAWLQGPAACGAPAYGSAGNRCISDRAPGGKFDWIAAYRTPIANDPRMAGRCDTGQTVILPTASTGYADTGITSTGGSSSSGLTAAEIASGAIAATTMPAAGIGGIPTSYLVLGGGLLFFLLVKS